MQALEKLLANFESQHARLLKLGAPDFVAMRDQARAALSTAAAAAPAIPDAITHTIQRALVKFSYSELERLRTLLEPENAAVAMFGVARIAAQQNIDDADAALNWLAAARAAKEGQKKMTDTTNAAPQEDQREDASYESMRLAVMVLSDCGHSSNYTPLLERVAGRIDRHVELLLTAQRAGKQYPPLPRFVPAPAHQDAISVLIQSAEGRISHTYIGDCPSAESPSSRDSKCPVCQAIDAARARQEHKQ